jgi:tetratricopeptide (TPR) repeat protein
MKHNPGRRHASVVYILRVDSAFCGVALATALYALAAPGEPSAPATAARIDELWKRRDQGNAMAEQKALLDEGLKQAPGDYGLLWRAARWHFWKGDDPALGKDERTRLGKQGWDLGEKAVAANPNDVSGHFWAMAAMGNYSLGLGIVRALAQRMEGKFKERIGRAEALNPRYADGAIAVAWGRYYAKLPWPKYDQKKARANFAKAMEINPNNLRARVFLAELMIEEDQPEEGRRLLQEVVKATPGKYDAPEERRSQQLAAAVLGKLE